MLTAIDASGAAALTHFLRETLSSHTTLSEGYQQRLLVSSRMGRDPGCHYLGGCQDQTFKLERNMSKVKRLAIRLALAEEKEKAYEEVDRLYHQGQKVESKEPAAGSSPSPWTAVSCTTQRVVPL